MLNIVETFLNKYSILNKEVIIAFSGGPDSSALAWCIYNLKDKLNLKPVLCYFNHGWRDEAKLEEKFTKKIAKCYDFKYIIGKMPDGVKKSEESARIYRYSFLNEASRKFNNCPVLLGHNKNDNVETLIYRVIKGTSIAGLTSIPESRDIYYRPLLTILKSDILNLIRDENLEYMVDSSNEDTKYKRNLIRNKIFPLFSEINPNFLNSISNLIENAELSKKIIDSAVYNISSDVIVKNGIVRSKFVELNLEIRYELIKNFVFDYLKYRDLKSIKKIDNFIFNSKKSKLSLNSDSFLVIQNDRIFIQKIEKNVLNRNILTVSGDGEYLFDKYKIKIKKTKRPDKFPSCDSNFCYLNVNFPIQIRYRQQGDIFSPVGFSGNMKLKKFFINEKIPESYRNSIILVADDKQVCWVSGYRISEKYKVCGNNCYKFEIIERD